MSESYEWKLYFLRAITIYTQYTRYSIRSRVYTREFIKNEDYKVVKTWRMREEREDSRRAAVCGREFESRSQAFDPHTARAQPAASKWRKRKGFQDPGYEVVRFDLAAHAGCHNFYTRIDRNQFKVLRVRLKAEKKRNKKKHLCLLTRSAYLCFFIPSIIVAFSRLIAEEKIVIFLDPLSTLLKLGETLW